MKFNKFAPLLLIATFIIGYLLTPSEYYLAEIPPPAKQIPPIPLPANEQEQSLDEDVAEIFPIDSEKEFTAPAPKYPFRLVETGDVFHGDEIDTRNGETWTGLFGEGQSFEVRPATVQVKRVRDEIIDGKGPGKVTGKSVSVTTGENPKFLLRGSGKFPSGETFTIFNQNPDEPNDEEYSNIRPGYRKDFTVGGSTYSLTSRKGVDIKGVKIRTLFIEGNGTSQLIHNVPDFEDNSLGSVEWAGDLDRDGKPDFYLGLYIHDNVVYNALFLSSYAGKGKLLKKVGVFSITGC